MKIAVAGATGVVGTSLLRCLVARQDVSEIYVYARKKPRLIDPKVRYVYSNFENLQKLECTIDVAFCTLGTTIKKAGNKDNFFKVDVEFCVNFAKHCKESGARTFSIVTSMGANANSIFFYSKCKGIVEKQVSSLNFLSLNIYRPALLIADREEKRFSEDLAKRVYRIIPSSFVKKLIGTNVETLSAFIADSSLGQAGQGNNIFESTDITDDKENT